jgi:hypothetical protein
MTYGACWVKEVQVSYRVTDIQTQSNGFRVYRLQDALRSSGSGLDAVLSVAPHNTQSFALESLIAINSVAVEDSGFPDWLERQAAAAQRRNRENIL